MKKVMIGVLILIPLLVVLTIGMVTSLLLSVEAYISVESIELENDTLNLEVTYSFDDYYYVDELISLIGITVYPERATNQDLEFTLANIILTDTEITDDNSDGRDDESGEYYLEFVKTDKSTHTSLIGTASDDLGYLRIGAYCYFDIVITAEGSITARCTVYVTGEITAITMPDEFLLNTGGGCLLEPVYTPIDAVVDNVTWTSSNSNIVSIDKNGIVTAQNVGEAIVTASVETADGIITSNVKITVSPTATTKFGNYVYTHRNDITFSELGISSSDVRPGNGATISGNSITLNSTISTIYVNDNEVTLELCDEDDIVIVESEFLSSGSNYVLGIGETGVWLTVAWKSDLKDGAPSGEVKWTWSDLSGTADITLANGYVDGISGGNVAITATVENKTASIEMTVGRKIAVVLLVDSDSSMGKGLARETVIGSGQYSGDGTYSVTNNTYTVEIKYPIANDGEDDFYDNFVFSVSSDEVPSISYYITFDGNTAVFDYSAMNSSGLFKEKVAITITVSAKYPRYSDSSLAKYATASFTFYVVDGIYTANFNEMQTALDKGITVTLSGDVAIYDINAYIDTSDNAYVQINGGADLYGNGYMYYADSELEVWKARLINVYSDSVIISNLTVRINPTADDTTIAEDGETYATGYGITSAPLANYFILDLTIEYCIVENGRGALSFYNGGQVLVEGCILRNTSMGAIHAYSTQNRFVELTLRNSVISNVPSPSNIEYNTSYNGDDTGETPSVPDGYPTRTTITIEGFLDAYCWFDVSQGSFLSNSTLEDALSSVITVNDDLLSWFQSLIQGALLEANYLSSFRRSYNNGIYMHVVFMSTGFYAKSYLVEDDNFKSEDTRFKIIDIDEVFNDEGLSTSTKGVLRLVSEYLEYPMYLWGYDNTVTDLTPGSECIVNSRLIDRLHGIY